MDLRVGTYDEGFLLTAAFREMLGQIPHRDFYFAYGPAQTYLLVGLFKLFGPSVLIERLYDLVIKAVVVASIWHFARKFTRPAIALTATGAVFLLLATISMNGSASVPASLAALWASWLLIQPATGKPTRNPFLAGLITAVALFFRYDVGLALCATNLLLIAILTFLQPGLTGANALEQIPPCNTGKEIRHPERREGPPYFDHPGKLYILRVSALSAKLRQLVPAFTLQAAPYLFGFGLLILPFATLVRAFGATKDLLFDCFTFPEHFFRAGRNLPLPGIHFRTLDDLAVYLPIPIVIAAILFLIQITRPNAKPEAKPSSAREALKIRPALTAFILLTLLFYAKGFIRISPVQLFPALVTSTLLLAILMAHRNLLHSGRLPSLLANKIHLLSSQLPTFLSARRKALGSASRLSTAINLRSITFALITLSLAITPISLVWLSLHRILDMRNHHAALLQTIFTSPNPNPPFTPETPLSRGLTFTPGDDKQTAINFLRTHTTPLDTLYVGVTHHDRIFANDNLTYFATGLLPATKWSEFDPGLQSQLPIQAQMVGDLEANRPPYIAIDSEFDQIREPNTSAQSSGVFLLDNYIAQHYHPVETLPTITIYQRLPR
jgi:hypothetical protein